MQLSEEILKHENAVSERILSDTAGINQYWRSGLNDTAGLALDLGHFIHIGNAANF